MARYRGHRGRRVRQQIDRVVAWLMTARGVAAGVIVSVVADVVIGICGGGLVGSIALGCVTGASGVILAMRVSRLT